MLSHFPSLTVQGTDATKASLARLAANPGAVFSGPGSRVRRTGYPLLVRIRVIPPVIQYNGSDRDRGGRDHHATVF